MRMRRTVLTTLALAIVGLALFGNNSSSSAVSNSPWVTQSFTTEPGDQALVSAFSNLSTVTLKTSLPPGMENVEVVKCQVTKCFVDVPGWATAIVLGGYDLGEPTVPVGLNGQALILHNVGEQKASFGYAAIGISYVLIAPYPDGRPEQLAQLTTELTGYLANIALNPNRQSAKSFEWNNMCSVKGCNSIQVAGYILDHGELPGARFTFYFRTIVQK